MKILYLAKPRYGGWATFVRHLCAAFGTNFLRVSPSLETKARSFGGGAFYQNIPPSALSCLQCPLIAAVDKHHIEHLASIRSGWLVIHDPTELSPELLAQAPRFKLIVIRRSMQALLLNQYGLQSTCLPHPYRAGAFPVAEKKFPVSISRIDFDKHIDILVEANRSLANPIRIYGAENRLYSYHKLLPLGWPVNYHGQFPASSAALASILAKASHVFDMSLIVGDGGGTQYTFLEAIDAGAALVLRSGWINAGDTFVAGENCLSADTPAQVVDVLSNADADLLSNVTRNATSLLSQHGYSNWTRHLAT